MARTGFLGFLEGPQAHSITDPPSYLTVGMRRWSSTFILRFMPYRSREIAAYNLNLNLTCLIPSRVNLPHLQMFLLFVGGFSQQPAGSRSHLSVVMETQ